MPTLSKPKVRFNPLVLLGVIPLFTTAAKELSLEIDEVKDEHSPGGAKITPEEGIDLARKILDKVAEPLARLIASGFH